MLGRFAFDVVSQTVVVEEVYDRVGALEELLFCARFCAMREVLSWG